MVNARHNSYELLRLILAFFVLISHAYWLKAFKKDKIVGDLYNQRYVVIQNFNINKWIND
jgi:hypothetical protein